MTNGTHWYPQPALPTPLGCSGMVLRAVSGSSQVAWVSWPVPACVVQHPAAVGTPPTAFVVLSKCHARETGESKVWQGFLSMGVYVYLYP